MKQSGKDASEIFEMFHGEGTLKKYGEEFLIGYLPGNAKSKL